MQSKKERVQKQGKGAKTGKKFSANRSKAKEHAGKILIFIGTPCPVQAELILIVLGSCKLTD
jgi:hypothetical protein